MGKRSLQGENNLLPVPMALLTFRSGSGQSRFVSPTWLGMTCERPSVLSAGFRAAGQTVRDLRSVGRFAVNLLPEPMPQQPAFRRILLEAAGDLQAAPGLSLCDDKPCVAPMIVECPIRIECRTTVFYTHFDQGFIQGEIAAVHLNGTRFCCKEAVDFYRLNPLASSSRPPVPHSSSCLPA